MKITRRHIRAEVRFLGTGKLTGIPHKVIQGGVPKPKLPKGTCFAFAADDVSGTGAKRAFQINVFGNSDAFQKLGEYLLSIAEIDTSIDANYHEHLDLTSRDGVTEVHFILRKSETGDFI